MSIKNRLFQFILILFLVSPIYSQTITDTLFIVTWNMENLFDAVDDPDKNDADFLPDGKKEWTQDKIDSKLEHQANVIKWMNSGKGPDILAVEEVEHQHLLDTLISKYLKTANYQVAYKESPDKRGIDNGLIYSVEKFELVEVKPIHVELPSKYPTRDILSVHLKNKLNGIDIFVFVNHWPSRRGGEEKSRPNRIKAASVLRTEIDSLQKNNAAAYIVILGDFNDEPNNLAISRYLWTQPFYCNNIVYEESLYNLAYKTFENGLGTYLYRGDWVMLDQIIVSTNVVNNKGELRYVCNSFQLIKPDFMITQNGKYKGAATPTFGGRKYIGGYSDHIPVGAKFLIVR